MVDIFWSMIKSASLLHSKIYETQETWTGQCELQYANYTLKTLAKGLKFFCPVSLSESPKVMGLTAIHHPDALHCFNGVTHCLWCGKEGQNEGTIVNHLWTTHYKLGLVCKNASAVHWLHPRPSGAMATRPASHLQMEAPTNYLHWPNHSARYVKSTLTHQRDGPGQRIRQGIGHPSNQHIGDNPTPLAQTQMEDQMPIKPTHWGHPAPLMWTCMEDQMHVKLRHTHHLYLLASCSGSGNVRMSPLQTGPLCIPYDGAVTVIQEVDANLCTPLLLPDTPTLSATSPFGTSAQVSLNCWILHQ